MELTVVTRRNNKERMLATLSTASFLTSESREEDGVVSFSFPLSQLAAAEGFKWIHTHVHVILKGVTTTGQAATSYRLELVIESGYAYAVVKSRNFTALGIRPESLHPEGILLTRTREEVTHQCWGRQPNRLLC